MPADNYWPTSSEEREDSSHASEQTSEGTFSDSLSDSPAERTLNLNPSDFTQPVNIKPYARLPSPPSSVSSAASTPSESGIHSSIASDTISESSLGSGTEEEEKDEDYSAQKSIESTLNTFRSSNPVFWESKPKDKPGSAFFE